MILRPASGIPQYEPTDIIGSAETVDDTLNVLADATHDSIVADRARLGTLEGRMDAADIQALAPSELFTLQAGWRLHADRDSVIRRIGSRIEFTVNFEKYVGGDIGHGNTMANVRPAWLPIADTEWFFTGVYQTATLGGTASGLGVLNQSAQFTALLPPSGKQVFRCSGFFHRV